jgi:hypothetical protein
MALFRIYPEKDAIIWSEPTTAGLYGNAGRDEVLEIGGYPDINLVGRTNRSLIQFKQTDITTTIDSKVTGGFSASLHLSLASATEIPDTFNIYAYPISSSWKNGTGKRNDSPVNRTGCSWKYKDVTTTEWTALGGDFLTSAATANSQSFDLTSTYDINMNVTTAVESMYSSSIENNGLLLKIDDAFENYTSASINLKFFGSDTHTIFPPYLEVKWDDSVYSSTLTELATDIATIKIKNHKPEYNDSDKARFRITARPKYPTRTFTTSSIYLTNYKLPENSYWGIQDDFSQEMIVDFDTTHTKVSADNTSSFFDIYMDILQPERYYKLLIKTTLDGSNIVIDNNNVFKVVKNG